jgi:hypothetical protein
LKSFFFDIKVKYGKIKPGRDYINEYEEDKMKKELVLFTFVCLLFMMLFGCKANSNVSESDPDFNEDSELTNYLASSERKIIYRVTANLYIEENYKDKLDDLKDSINDDEWTDFESIDEDSADIVFRIKTTRLDAFIDSLKDFGSVRNLNKTATDVSLQYQDNTDRIMALEIEKEQLLILYDNATNLAEIIQINTRRAQIEEELMELRGENRVFDDQIEYSVVRVYIYNEAPKEDDLPYGQKLKDAFLLGIKSFVKFLEVISLVFVIIFPYLLVIAVLIVAIWFFRRLHLKRKKGELTKVNKNPQERH